MAESEMTDDREFWQKEFICSGKKARVGDLSHLMRRVHGKSHLSRAVHIWMTESSERNIFCRLRKSWQQLSSNENEAHLSLAVHTCLTENLWLPETKLWLLPESESSSRDAAARLKWDASNSSRSPLPLPSRTTQGLNQWE